MGKVFKIAVKMNGGMGTVLVRMNFIHCLYEYLDDCDVEIRAFGHKSDEVNDAIFHGQPAICAYYNEKMWKSLNRQECDLVFELDLFPRIYYASDDVRNSGGRLRSVFDVWSRFQEDYENELYYRRLRESKPYMYARLINNHRTILNSADIGGMLGIGNEYSMPVICGCKEADVLKRFKLQDTDFITIQRGVNPKLGMAETPKLWRMEYYDRLVEMLKNSFPEMKIVQLGESDGHCQSIRGVDRNLLGKTSWDDLKILLKRATLHIDGECGMVHMRKALHAGPSIVLFGPTPVELFGYEGNINICSHACRHWCAELRDDWEYHCLNEKEPAVCMNAITPEAVMDKISAYLKGDASVLYHQPKGCNMVDEILTKYAGKLDTEWSERFLSKWTIFGYEEEMVPVTDLEAHIFDGKEWKWVSVEETPAYALLAGDEAAYNENMRIRDIKLPDNIHSTERYRALIKSMECDDDVMIVIDSKNLIKDGQHRAAIWRYKYGKDAKIKALRLYMQC